MRSRSLLGRLLQDQILFAVFTALLLLLGGTGATAILLRKHQDHVLRSLAHSICHAIGQDRKEDSDTFMQATREVLSETYLSDIAIEVEGSDGTSEVSSGMVEGWSPEETHGQPAPGDCVTRRHREQRPAPDVRVCAHACGPDHGILVAAANIHGDPDVRLAIEALCGTFLLLLAVSALAGRALIRRRLLPLQRLAEAASRLKIGSGSALGVGADASELARLEASLDGLVHKLHEALLREKRFTQEASHELRTSLTVLRTRMEGLTGRARTPAELQSETRALMAQLDGLDRLVEALLLIARSEEDAGIPSRPVNLCDLAREAAQARQDADPPISPPPEVVAPDEILVMGSEELLERALFNLVENARKFAGAAARIRIQVSRDNACARVSVEDDGPGIPSASRPHVFERFYRDPSRRGIIAGTGLGLAVVRSIVARHRGEVSTARSEDLGGEAVCFWLPALVGAGEEGP